MATKFKLDPNPTFKANVGIPVPGEEPAQIPFEFKYYAEDEWDAYLKEHPGINIRDTLFDIVLSWEIDGEPFSRESLIKMFNKYPGSVNAIWQKFNDERYGIRAKN